MLIFALAGITQNISLYLLKQGILSAFQKKKKNFISIGHVVFGVEIKMSTHVDEFAPTPDL